LSKISIKENQNFPAPRMGKLTALPQLPELVGEGKGSLPRTPPYPALGPPSLAFTFSWLCLLHSYFLTLAGLHKHKPHVFNALNSHTEAVTKAQTVVRESA